MQAPQPISNHTRAKWLLELNEGLNDPFEFICEDKWFCHTCELTLKVKKNKEVLKKHLDTQGHQKCKNAKAKPPSINVGSSNSGALSMPGYGAGPLPLVSESNQAMFEENKRRRIQ